MSVVHRHGDLGPSGLDRCRCTLRIQSFVVEGVLSETGSDALQIGHVTSDLLDRLHLLLKELRLNEVAELKSQ